MFPHHPTSLCPSKIKIKIKLRKEKKNSINDLQPSNKNLTHLTPQTNVDLHRWCRSLYNHAWSNKLMHIIMLQRKKRKEKVHSIMFMVMMLGNNILRVVH